MSTLAHPINYQRVSSSQTSICKAYDNHYNLDTFDQYSPTKKYAKIEEKNFDEIYGNSLPRTSLGSSPMTNQLSNNDHMELSRDYYTPVTSLNRSNNLNDRFLATQNARFLERVRSSSHLKKEPSTLYQILAENFSREKEIRLKLSERTKKRKKTEAKILLALNRLDTVYDKKENKAIRPTNRKLENSKLFYKEKRRQKLQEKFWTADHDAILETLVKDFGDDWDKISEYFNREFITPKFLKNKIENVKKNFKTTIEFEMALNLKVQYDNNHDQQPILETAITTQYSQNYSSNTSQIVNPDPSINEYHNDGFEFIQGKISNENLDDIVLEKKTNKSGQFDNVLENRHNKSWSCDELNQTKGLNINFNTNDCKSNMIEDVNFIQYNENEHESLVNDDIFNKYKKDNPYDYCYRKNSLESDFYNFESPKLKFNLFKGINQELYSNYDFEGSAGVYAHDLELIGKQNCNDHVSIDEFFDLKDSKGNRDHLDSLNINDQINKTEDHDQKKKQIELLKTKISSIEAIFQWTKQQITNLTGTHWKEFTVPI